MEGPPQKQQQQPSGSEAEMKPRPVALDVRHKGSGKLRNKARNANARMLCIDDAMRTAAESCTQVLRTFGKLDILVRCASSPKPLVALTHGTLGQPCGHPDSAGLSVRHHAQAAARDVQDECILHVLLHASGAAAPGGPRLHHQQCVRDSEAAARRCKSLTALLVQPPASTRTNATR